MFTSMYSHPVSADTHTAFARVVYGGATSMPAKGKGVILYNMWVEGDSCIFSGIAWDRSIDLRSPLHNNKINLKTCARRLE